MESRGDSVIFWRITVLSCVQWHISVSLMHVNVSILNILTFSQSQLPNLFCTSLSHGRRRGHKEMGLVFLMTPSVGTTGRLRELWRNWLRFVSVSSSEKLQNKGLCRGCMQLREWSAWSHSWPLWSPRRGRVSRQPSKRQGRRDFSHTETSLLRTLSLCNETSILYMRDSKFGLGAGMETLVWCLAKCDTSRARGFPSFTEYR